VTWFGLRHVFVLVKMTDDLTALGRMWLRSPTRAPSSLARSVLELATGQTCPPRTPESGARGVDRSGPAGASRDGSLPALRGLPSFSPAATDTVRRLFRAVVLVEMITPRSSPPAMLCTRAAGSQPPSPDNALRSLEDPERAGPGAAGIGRARNSIARPKARSEAPQARDRCDPGAEPLAGPAAGPMARSSSGGSCPVVGPAHAPGGVAG